MNKVSGRLYEERRRKGKCVVKYCSKPARKDKGSKMHREYCHKHQRESFKESKPFSCAYSEHKCHCKKRSIPCEWTLIEFTDWCIENKYIELKGRGAGKATIDRIRTRDDNGNVLGYKIGNVQIMEHVSNCRKHHIDKKLMEKYGNGTQEPTEEELNKYRSELNAFGNFVNIYKRTSGECEDF